MSEPLEHALARLLTEVAWREELARDAPALGRRLGLNEAELALLVGLDLGDLAAQADVIAHVRRRSA
jgi:hypothetical protein